MSTSIQEIAKKAGVSCVTVSRALNHPEQVTPETCAKIQKIFTEMNYKPRVIPNRLDTVNLLLPSPPAYITMHDGILFSSISNLITEKGYHSVLSPRKAMGIQNIFHKVYVAVLTEGDTKMSTFIRDHSAKTPFIVISDTSESLPENVPVLGSDHKQGTTLAIEYLLKRGHTRIGYVGNNLTCRGYREKFEAYTALMKKNNCFCQDYIFLNDEKLLFEGLQRLCNRKVTALFIAEESLTLKAIYYLDLLGKKVPEDISVVSKEISGSTEFLYPPITCIIQPLIKLSSLVVDYVLKRINEPDAVIPRNTYIPYDFVERESVISIN